MICKILTQYQIFQQERSQKFFEGSENVPLAQFHFVNAESSIVLGVPGNAPRINLEKLHSNMHDFSAF